MTTDHLDTLRTMLHEMERADRRRDAPRIAALRAALAALETPAAVQPPKEIVVRLGGHATSTKYTYQLHENGRATRLVDSEKEFKSEGPLSWKMRDDGVTLEIAFT